MMRRVLWTTFAAAGLAASLGGEALAATNLAFVQTASGQASGGSGPFGCATSGPNPTVSGFFGGGIPVPAEGHAACGLAGGAQTVTNTGAPSLVSTSLVNTLNDGVNTASAQAKSDDSMALGTEASEAYTGTTVNSRTYAYSEAAAIWSDTFDPIGDGEGSVRFRFDLDGSMSVSGSGDALTQVSYQLNSEPIYTAFNAGLGRSFTPFANNGTGVGALSGFTITPTSISGGDTIFTFEHFVNLSNPLTFKIGLYTAAYSGQTSAVANDFFNTLSLQGVDIYDAFGRPIEGARLTGTSGYYYDATGAHRIAAVPEPSQWTLMILGFGLVGVRVRRRHPGRRLDPRGTAVERELAAVGAV